MEELWRRVSRRLREAQTKKGEIVRGALKNSNVYFGQPPILDYLAEHEGGTQKEIADALQVTAASVSVSLRRMQKSGLLERAADTRDLRCNSMRLTEEGYRQRERLHRCFTEFDRKIYRDFSEEELTTLAELLERLCANLETIRPQTAATCAGGALDDGKTD